ncbi:MAG: lipoprotein insertase outer membrane protein LolB [Pseudomonadota bacterium]|nr:lipoprotein insertase outer membrane protein LolB [Pseudomonadota bacterium]
MSSRRFGPALASLLVIALAGCASLRVEPLPEGLTDQPPEGWARRQQQVAQLTHWDLSGKIAVRQPSDSGSGVINHWKQRGDYYDLSLASAFLGMGATRLKGVPGYMQLTLSDGETYQSADPEALLKAATGWELPLNGLIWWVRGLPEPGYDFRLLFDEQGRLASIRQHGWDIRYDRWHNFMDSYPRLPARITALKGERRVRLVITRWQENHSQPQ